MRSRLSLLVMVFLAVSPAALGEAPSLASSAPQLEAGARAKFDRGLLHARAELPEVFSGVQAVIHRADGWDHQRRGKFFPMTPVLRQLVGASSPRPGAALALLEPFLYPERFAWPVSPTA